MLSFNLVDYINLFVYNLLLRMCLFKGILYSQDHIFLSIIHIDICWGFPLYLHSSSSGASWLLLKLLLIYNILLVSDVQQSDSVIYISYIYILSQILFLYRLLHDIEYSSLCCAVGPCIQQFIYGNLLVPNS